MTPNTVAVTTQKVPVFDKYCSKSDARVEKLNQLLLQTHRLIAHQAK